MEQSMKHLISKYYDNWIGMNSVYEKWAKLHDLTYNTLMTLWVIHNFSNDCTSQLISEKLQLPKQTVSAILSSLEKAGHIVKTSSNKDKRNKNIVFTASGEVYANRILTELYEFECKVLSDMKESDLIQMLKYNDELLHKFRNVLEANV
ncbi:MAG: MarR family winged helix-turn-helix transcriptional regulator [Mobilitalea sp.]